MSHPSTSAFPRAAGVGRQRERTISLDEKDNEIAHLHQQLSAHTQRVSHLEYCLLATLDFLDSTRSAASNDLKHANERNALLQRKLRELEAMNAAAEAEKDDLRDAVLLLVEKVEENNNDFSCLPYARLRMTRALSLAPQQDPGPSRSRTQTSCQCPQAYAPSVFRELSHQLDFERDAHAKTKSDAETNIALLECAIARRDAEIEKWISSTVTGIPDNSSFDVDRVTPLKRLTEISQEGMRRIDALTTERNELLKTELTVLKDKLRRLEQESPPLRKSSSRTRFNKGVQVGSSSPTATSAKHPIPSSRPSSRASSHRDRHDATHKSDTHSVADALHELDRRLGILRQETHELQRKRGRLAVVVESRMGMRGRGSERGDEGETGNGDVTSSDSDFSRVLAIEDECVRLQQSEKALQEELERVRKFASSRQSELEEEIRRLRFALERSTITSTVRPSASSSHESPSAPPSPIHQPPLSPIPIPDPVSVLAPVPALAHDTSHAVTYVSSSPNTSIANDLVAENNHSSSSGVPSELNMSFPPLTPEHPSLGLSISPIPHIPPNPGLDDVSPTETETELDTELADDDALSQSYRPDPGQESGIEPEASFSSRDNGHDTSDQIDDERFFAEPSSSLAQTGSNDIRSGSWSPIPLRSPQPQDVESGQEETDARPVRDIAAIEQELAQIRQDEERRAREAEELRESIAMLQRIHSQSGERNREL